VKTKVFSCAKLHENREECAAHSVSKEALKFLGYSAEEIEEALASGNSKIQFIWPKRSKKDQKSKG
jgi:Holliday junction resolvasome RuvABC DNA-binding subunit